VISNSTGSLTSRNALLTVTPAVSTAGTDVVTYKNDLARTGQNLNEKTLTPANVKHARFGKLQFLSTDGKVDAQPLYLSALSIGGVKHNVVFVATENDSAYAFDADTGTQLWKVSLVPAGETVASELPQVCDVIEPTIGVTATPVIDRGAGAHGTIYLVAMTKSSTTWHQRLHALDVTTGAEVAGGPREITATYDTAGGTITFDPGQYLERAGLLLLNHTVYTTWTSHCDNKFYTGWIIAYNQGTLQRTAVLNIAPNSGGVGPSIWMSGGAPAVDAAGNIYVITANGAFESTLDAAGFPNLGDYGNSFLKLSTSGGGLRVTDYFAPNNTAFLSAVDFDLGAGGVMLLPDMTDSSGTVRHLAVGAGKDGNMYVINRDAMGHFSPSSNNIWQQLNGVLGGGIWSTPAYFNGHIYYGQDNGALKSFSISAAQVVLPAGSSSSVTFGFPGTAPSVSANGTANGIVWAHQNANPAVLYAFDANDVSKQLYSSSQAANGRDQFGAGNKFVTPVIADGKVFVGAASGVAVFGLLK
jgi:outer membrane protein assembly factor BamB